MLRKVFLILSLIAVHVSAQKHELPCHRATEWCRLSLEDFKGTIRVPVVFINFSETNGSDTKTITEANQNFWMERLNEKCSTNHMKENGSVNDYFLAQSYGQMNVEFESIGSYTAAGSAAAYADYKADASLVINALKSVGQDVDWSKFDCNGDKEVDCVLAIYAGHADGDYNSRRAVVTSIYPHRNWLAQYNLSLSIGDYEFSGYVFSQELRDASSAIAPIHTVCHELGHGILDLTDYYKNLTSYLGQYDAMCYGFRQTSYSAANNHCCNMTSFNRMYMGWLTPQELNEPCHVVLEPLSQKPEACIIFDPKNANHFFLLENRAKIADSWDVNLPGEGLLLTEINWNRNNFEFHNVNSGSVKNIRVISAATNSGIAIPNASYYNYDQSTIPFGSPKYTSITSAVNPIFENYSITNITINADHSLEFDFMGGTPNSVETPISHISTPEYYNLKGQRIKLPKGICIMSCNGKNIKIYR